MKGIHLVLHGTQPHSAEGVFLRFLEGFWLPLIGYQNDLHLEIFGGLFSLLEDISSLGSLPLVLQSVLHPNLIRDLVRFWHSDLLQLIRFLVRIRPVHTVLQLLSGSHPDKPLSQLSNLCRST